MNETEADPEDTKNTPEEIEEVVWLTPQSDEEQALFDSLLNEIKAMHTFARERGIEVPEAVINGLSTLLAISKPTARHSGSETAGSEK